MSKISRDTSPNSFDEVEETRGLPPVSSLPKIEKGISIKGIQSKANGLMSNDTTSINTSKCTRPVLALKDEFILDGFKRKSCKSLICIECDIKVSFYPHSRWKENFGYMFYRSYFGNEAKMREGQTASADGLALHCGCKGVSVNQPIFVEDVRDLKWSCLGHN